MLSKYESPMRQLVQYSGTNCEILKSLKNSDKKDSNKLVDRDATSVSCSKKVVAIPVSEGRKCFRKSRKWRQFPLLGAPSLSLPSLSLPGNAVTSTEKAAKFRQGDDTQCMYQYVYGLSFIIGNAYRVQYSSSSPRNTHHIGTKKYQPLYEKYALCRDQCTQTLLK